jgi:hypothetical protein
MSKYIRSLVLAVVLILPCSAGAEVKIPRACRVKNRPPGRCGWCALETLARHLHIRSLYSVVDENPRLSRPGDLEGVLVQTEVHYRIQYPGSYGEDILRYGIREDLGVLVGFRELHPGAGGHIVTLVDFTSEEARVIDSNDADGRIRTMPLDRFLYWWDGFALVLNRSNVEAE